MPIEDMFQTSGGYAVLNFGFVYPPSHLTSQENDEYHKNVNAISNAFKDGIVVFTDDDYTHAYLHYNAEEMTYGIYFNLEPIVKEKVDGQWVDRDNTLGEWLKRIEKLITDFGPQAAIEHNPFGGTYIRTTHSMSEEQVDLIVKHQAFIKLSNDRKAEAEIDQREQEAIKYLNSQGYAVYREG